MQHRRLLDDASAAGARAPVAIITGADAVDAVSATSNGRRCCALRGEMRGVPRGRRQRRRPQQDARSGRAHSQQR